MFHNYIVPLLCSEITKLFTLGTVCSAVGHEQRVTALANQHCRIPHSCGHYVIQRHANANTYIHPPNN